MARAFNHALHIVLPGKLGQLAQGFQLAKLGLVVGVGHRARTQAIAQREGHIVGLHDLADVFKVRVQEVFLVMCQTPLGHNRAAATDNTGHPLGGQGHITQQHARVDGEVIHPLFGLLNQGIAEDLPGQVLGHAVHLFQRLVNGHGANGHMGVTDNPLAGFVNVFTGG